MRFSLFLMLVMGLPFGVSAAEQRTDLHVVELFTSQGCSSCPPADQILSELADQPNVLALGFHVDYWNYLGWEDTLSAAFATERQVAYRTVFNNAYVYTPQFVVNGDQEFQPRTHAMLAQTLARPFAAEIDTAWAGDTLHLRATDRSPAGGQVLLLTFEEVHSVDIRRGENAGNMPTYRNAVHTIGALAPWENQDLSLPIPGPETLPEGHGLAVLVTDMAGEIVATASWTVPAAH